MHANFIVVAQWPQGIVIQDIGPWTEHKTITNDAEWVVSAVEETVGLGGRRLFYIDSIGELDEIIHKDGKFVAFRDPGRTSDVKIQLDKLPKDKNGRTIWPGDTITFEEFAEGQIGSDAVSMMYRREGNWSAAFDDVTVYDPPPTKFVYDIIVHLNIGEAIPSVGDMVRSVNASMKSFGFSETLMIESRICVGTMTFESQPTDAVIQHAVELLEYEMMTALQDRFQRVEIVPHVEGD